MISNKEFDTLINLKKSLIDKSTIILPEKGGKMERIIESISQQENFILNIERGRIKLSKVKYQSRHKITNTVLLRIDTNGPRHQNPDGNYIEGPHIHIYREGYGSKWAFQLDKNIFKDTENLSELLVDFLKYFNVQEIPRVLYNESLF